MHHLPSSNSECGSISWVRARSGKGGVAADNAGGDRGCELNDGNIAVKRGLVEARVGLDRRNLDERSTRSPALQKYQSLPC